MDITPTTELEAVNLMLDTIDESPVNSLENSGVLDAVVARRQLTAMSRRTQSMGWRWNTEADYELARSLPSGEINLPLNTLRFRISGRSAGLNVTQRGLRLYDRANQTFAFTASVFGELVLFLPFEEMPETARNFVTLAAARKFQQGRVGSEVLNGFAQRDELQAWANLLDDEAETADYNVIRDNPSMREMLFR
ncbi:hypothetical protein [Labrys neptuniae]